NSIGIGSSVTVTASNQVRLGNANITTLYCQGAYAATTTSSPNLFVNSTGQIMRSSASVLTGSVSANKIAFGNGSNSLSYNNNLHWDNTNSRLGIGTTAPDKPLSISGTGANNELISFKNGSTTEWHINMNGGGINFAETTVADYILYLEQGGDVGINTGNPLYKLQVIDDQPSSNDPAIYGEHAVTDNYGVGVKGVGKWKGVIGEASSASGVIVGVHGSATGAGTGTRIGVYGVASGGASAYAGSFVGDVSITGTLSKGGGSFKIDHPLDPENKYLYHSFVESPDMKNIYDGVVVLDANGEAAVVLPDWFEALNKDFRYQLTAIGVSSPGLYVSQKVSGNTFRIGGGIPGTEVSWQVTGIRKDPFANANRIPVEADKSIEDKGYYLYPEVYKQPETMSIDYKNHQVKQ
ncbi:MAG: hypothetical protein ABIJ16_14325, partial [Bacteroidota bacterium]